MTAAIDLPFHTERTAAPFCTVLTKLTDYQIWGLLTSAFEGGSNYWIRRVTKTRLDQLTRTPVFLQDYPFLGAALQIEVQEVPMTTTTKIPPVARGVWQLDRAALITGCQTMADLPLGKGGHHWASVVSDDSDAETGDVFLQCALFGLIVFG